MSDIDVNKIQQNVKELQDQNAIDFQQWKKLGKDIEKLSEKIKLSDNNLNILMKKIKNDYEKLKKIVVDENVQVQLNNKIEQNKNEIVDNKNKIDYTKIKAEENSNKIEENKNEINKKVNSETFENKVNKINLQISDIENNKTDKITTQNLQTQVNNLVLGAVGDGNNAEVIQARGSYTVLDERFNANELKISKLTNKLSGYFNTSGVFTGLDSWTTCVDFIAIESIKSINVYLWWSQGAICCYDKALNFIGFIQSSTVENAGIDVLTSVSQLLNGTAYIRYCYSNTKISIVEYENVISQTLINETLNHKKIIGDLTSNYYYNTSGVLTSLSGWYSFENKIPVKSIKTINIPLWKNVGCICCYDINGIFISSIQSTVATPTPTEFFTDLANLPTNTCYISYCFRKNYPVNIELKNLLNENINLLNEIIKNLMSMMNSSKILPLIGKKILCLGDSYTFLNYYGKALEEVTGATQTPRGWNGAGIYSFVADQYTPTGGGGTVIDQKFNAELLQQYDIVTIMGGTNDYGRARKPLGNLKSEKGDTSVYGALMYAIEKILSLKSTIKIVLCTQPYRLDFEGHTAPGGYLPNSQGFTMEDVANALIEVGGHYGIPVFDFYRNSGWNSFTVKKINGVLVENPYTYDGLHPKSGEGNGGEMLGKAFGYFINNHVTF